MQEFLELIEDIRFVGIDDFMDKKDYIKNKFNDFELNTRELYKWYFFYELCLLKDNILKECAWDYLHGKETYYKNEHITLEERYKEFCHRRDKVYGELDGQMSFIDIQ